MSATEEQHEAELRPNGRSAGKAIRGGSALLWAATLTAAALLSVMNLWRGALNQDEGWYLYAARLVAEGRHPYVDFATTQGPVMPHVYALANPLIARWGVAGGRAFTAVLGLLAAATASLLAWRIAPPNRRDSAAFLAFALAAVNVYQSYFTTIVKTYALAGLFLTAAFALLSCWPLRRGRMAAFGAGILLALAAGTRLSAGAALPAAGAALVWAAFRARGRALTKSPAFHAALALGAGFALAALALFLPFALRAPQALWFALAEYHAGRQAGGGLVALAYKAGFASRVVQAYFVALALGAAAIVWGWRTRRNRPAGLPEDHAESEPAARHAVALAIVAITVLHAAAPFPYDDYQAMAFPLLAAWVACALVRAMAVGGTAAAPAAELKLRAFVLALCLASSFSSPINQDWFLARRDRIWWPLRTETPLRRLRNAGRLVRSLAAARPGETLLTQDPYLAVESGLRLPDGMALGPFCYFPDWPREKAERRHVLNRDMLLETIASGQAPVAAFSGYGLAIRAPDIAPLSEAEQAELQAAVRRVYRLAAVVNDFGQADTVLRIYVRRDDADKRP